MNNPLNKMIERLVNDRLGEEVTEQPDDPGYFNDEEADEYPEWAFEEPSTPDNRRTRVIDPAAIYQIDPKASK